LYVVHPNITKVNVIYLAKAGVLIVQAIDDLAYGVAEE
jgi:hypothetical protein